MYKERTKSEYDFEIAKYAGGIKEITSNTTYEQLTKIRKTCPFSTRYYKLNTQIFDNEVLKSLKFKTIKPFKKIIRTFILHFYKNVLKYKYNG